MSTLLELLDFALGADEGDDDYKPESVPAQALALLALVAGLATIIALGALLRP